MFFSASRDLLTHSSLLVLCRVRDFSQVKIGSTPNNPNINEGRNLHGCSAHRRRNLDKRREHSKTKINVVGHGPSDSALNPAMAAHPAPAVFSTFTRDDRFRHWEVGLSLEYRFAGHVACMISFVKPVRFPRAGNNCSCS